MKSVYFDTSLTIKDIIDLAIENRISGSVENLSEQEIDDALNRNGIKYEFLRRGMRIADDMNISEFDKLRIGSYLMAYGEQLHRAIHQKQNHNRFALAYQR